MKNVAILALLIAVACAGSLADGGPWRSDALKRQAASDFACDADALSTYESSSRMFSVRGCGKKALYEQQSCNRVTRECVYVLHGAIFASTPMGGQAPIPTR